ncbi:MAG: adenylate/guanylate cyclase domain-containing protein [Acidimicrobiales bacterium]
MSDDDQNWEALEKELVGRRYLDAEATAAAAGVEREISIRLWRAIGFPDAPEGELVFGDLDVEMLRSAYGLVSEGLLGLDTLLALARTTGQAQSRAAESQVQAITESMANTGPEADPIQYARIAIPGLERFINYTWRRHMLDAISRELSTTTEGMTVVLAVGFADMVGFTALSQQASEIELSDVVRRFEDLAYDIVASGGGRVVKMIGDEVFFVAESARAGAEIALSLASTYASDDRLPDIRVGLSIGPVLPRAGDYLGAAVNLASRLVNLARPASVLVSEQLAEALTDQPDYELRRLRSRNLKGIGRVSTIVLRRQGVPGSKLSR